MLDLKVSRLRDHFAKHATTYDLDTVLKEIQTGAGTVNRPSETMDAISLEDRTTQARNLLSNGNHDAYGVVKKDCAAFANGAIFEDGRREASHSNGIVVVEYDNIDDVAYTKSQLLQHPHVYAAWVSLGGKGLKIIAIPDPTPTLEEYQVAWCSAKFMFDDIVEGEADIRNKTATALTAITHDPDIIIKPDVSAFDWSDFDIDDVAELVPIRIDSENSIGFASVGKLTDAHKEAIAEMDWADNNWGRTSVPCIFAEHEHDGWGSRRNACGIRRAKYHYTFSCFKCNQSIRVDRYVDPQDLPPIYAIERMPAAFQAYRDKYPDPDIEEVIENGEGFRVVVRVKSNGDTFEVHGVDYLMYHLGIDLPVSDWPRDDRNRLQGKYAKYWRSLNTNLKQFTGQSDKPVNKSYVNRLFRNTKGEKDE